VILAGAIVLILVFLFFSFNYTTKEVERTRIIIQEKKVVQYIVNLTNPNNTQSGVITNNIYVVPEHSATYSKLAYILYKVFEIEYKCKKIRSLPDNNRDSDGTWNICDDYSFTAPCVEYSFGIANDFRFEDSFHTTFGCDVFCFDPSMGQQDHQRSPGVMFYNMGINFEKSDKYEGNEYGRADRKQYWKVDTVGGFMKRFNHTKGTVLKVDVEGSEWDALTQAADEGALLKFDQLLFEIHLWHWRSNLDGVFNKWYNLFKKLETQGWKLFYSHVNPLSTQEKFPNHLYVPCCYELSLINTRNIPNGN
jgi:hypothetical protein